MRAGRGLSHFSILLSLTLYACGSGNDEQAANPKLSSVKCDPRSGQRTIGLQSFIGGYGNQIFEYLFVKIYAQRHHLSTEIPYWTGDDLFNLDDIKKTTPFCAAVSESSQDLIDSFDLKSKSVFSNYDLWGFFSNSFLPLRCGKRVRPETLHTEQSNSGNLAAKDCSFVKPWKYNCRDSY